MKDDDEKLKNEKLSKQEIIRSRTEIQKSIFEQTEGKVDQKFTDENLDRENLKVQLLSGAVIDLEELGLINKKPSIYTPRFPNDYYLEMYRLNKWSTPEDGVFSQKRSICGTWTNEIIYGRFGKQVLPTLQHLNPIDRIGLRMVKHHQHLNEKGLEKLEMFISESVELMKESSTWYEFRSKLYHKYGVPFQLDIFREDEK